MRTLPTRRSLAVLSILGLLAPALSPATPITVKFTGHVPRAGRLAVPPELKGIVSKGDPVAGEFTFDPTRPDAEPDANIGAYRYIEPQFGMWVRIGGARLESRALQPELDVNVRNDVDGADRFEVTSAANAALAPSSIESVEATLAFDDPTGEALATDAMPSITTLLRRFDPRRSAGRITSAAGSSARLRIEFTIETMTIEAPLVHVDLVLSPTVIGPDQDAPWIAASLRPGRFAAEEIDPASLVLADAALADPRCASLGDFDQDGIEDLHVRFSRDDVRARLSAGLQEVVVRGQLKTGEGIVGSDLLRVLSATRHAVRATVAPNPLNPAGTITFRTESEGQVTARLYDAMGRRVRTLLASRALAAGEHRLAIDGRDEAGRPLAGGVYYFRIEAGDEVSTGRVAVLK